jgi:hypothetical protein
MQILSTTNMTIITTTTTTTITTTTTTTTTTITTTIITTIREYVNAEMEASTSEYKLLEKLNNLAVRINQ